MGDHATDFVTRFQCLEGDTISDRKKNFNKLLRDPSFSTNKQQIHDALDKLETKTYLESLFKVDALIYFRHSTRLLEVLKEGNEVFISKILKQHWFFEEIFQNADADNLVNEFLRCLSFVMRMKVLKRLSLVLDEHKMDAIYDCLYKRYGLWIAQKILHTCTKEKLKSVFDNQEITLRAHQVLFLYNKNSDLFEMYVDYYKNIFQKTYSESKITNHIANKNPKFLLKLEKQARISVSCLGRRTSKKFFPLVKDKIFKEFDRYQYLINRPILIKKMGSEFKNFYFQRFPKKINDIDYYSECRTLLRYYPKNKRWELFKDAFQQKFPGKTINELYLTVGNDIENLNPSRQVIASWAEVHYKYNDDDSFLQYFPTSKAITLIKEKINVTSDIYKRRNLINLLVLACKKNDDLNALEEVLKYVCFRHRNEDVNFKQNFLNEIRNTFNWHELNKTHWDHISEMIKILEIQNQFPFWRYSIFLIRRLEFLVKSGENFREYLIEFMRTAIDEGNCFTLSLENPEIERKIFIEMIDVFPEAMENRKENVIFERHIAFMCEVIKFSEKYAEYAIDLGQYEHFSRFFTEAMKNSVNDSENLRKSYTLIAAVLVFKDKFPQCSLPVTYDQNLVDLITKRTKHDGMYAFTKCLSTLLLKKRRNDFENLLLDSYFRNISNRRNDEDIINWFLINEPKTLVPYLTQICTTFDELKFEIIKLYSHFDFDKEFIAQSMKLLEEDDVKDYASRAKILRMLLPTSEFASLIENKFVPTKVKLDLEDKQMKELYDIQCKIAKELHKVEEPFKILPVVLKFCVGDYLQSALPSLQGVFYKSPEKELYHLVDDLSNKAVSVRKHAVFLTCELLEQECAMEMLSKEDKNVSSQKHLFTAALKYFKKNPSQELLEMVVKNMSTIDKNDTESLESLVNVTVPKKYRGFYIEKCWKFYESMKINGVNVESYLENLLGNIVKHVDLLIALPPSFIENVIDNYFCENLQSYSVANFLCTYLIHTEHSTSKYLDPILKKLSKAKTNDITSFVECLTKLNLTRDFMLTLLNHWNAHFDTMETFEAHIMLNLLLFNVTSNENLAQNIVIYLEELLENFSGYAFDLFKQVFKHFTSVKEAKEQYELLIDMISFKTSPDVCILILYVILVDDDDESEHYTTYQSIIATIKTVQDPIVKIYYKKFVTDNNLE